MRGISSCFESGSCTIRGQGFSGGWRIESLASFQRAVGAALCWGATGGFWLTKALGGFVGDWVCGDGSRGRSPHQRVGFAEMCELDGFPAVLRFCPVLHRSWQLICQLLLSAE